MSAAFLDPLFSGGSAFLSDSNRMIGDLIETDLLKVDERALRNKCIAYDAHSHWWLDNFLLHITGNYHASYDLLRQQFEPLLMDFFGIILPTSLAKNWGYDPSVEYGDGEVLRAQKAQMFSSSPNHRVHAMKEELAHFSKEREGVYARNRGQYFALDLGEDYVRHTRERGRNLTLNAVRTVQMKMLSVSARRALTRMGIIGLSTSKGGVTNARRSRAAGRSPDGARWCGGAVDENEAHMSPTFSDPFLLASGAPPQSAPFVAAGAGGSIWE